MDLKGNVWTLRFHKFYFLMTGLKGLNHDRQEGTPLNFFGVFSKFLSECIQQSVTFEAYEPVRK